MENRATRRRRERQQQRDGMKVREGLTVGQLKAAEADLADGAVGHESSRATTMAVLAHGWYALDHQREASRVTYQRIIELRKGGRELKTDDIVKQYAEAKEEILVLESQIVGLLERIAEEDGEEVALGLLGASHMNLMNGLGVRFPEAIRTRFAWEADLIAPLCGCGHEEGEHADGKVCEVGECKCELFVAAGEDSTIDPPDSQEPKQPEVALVQGGKGEESAESEA